MLIEKTDALDFIFRLGAQQDLAFLIVMIIKNNSLLSECLLVMVLAHTVAATIKMGLVETSQIASRTGDELSLRSNDGNVPSNEDPVDIPDDDEPVEHKFGNPLTFMKGESSFLKTALAVHSSLMAAKIKRDDL